VGYTPNGGGGWQFVWVGGIRLPETFPMYITTVFLAAVSIRGNQREGVKAMTMWRAHCALVTIRYTYEVFHRLSVECILVSINQSGWGLSEAYKVLASWPGEHALSWTSVVARVQSPDKMYQCLSCLV